MELSYFFTMTIFTMTIRNACLLCCSSFCNFCGHIICLFWYISSYSVIEVSLDSNYNLFCTYDNFYIHINMFYYSIFWFELHVVLINFHLQSHEICSVIALASLLFVIILHSLTFLPGAQRRRDVSVRSHISRDVADHAETLLRRRNKYVNETDLLETSLRRLIST